MKKMNVIFSMLVLAAFVLSACWPVSGATTDGTIRVLAVESFLADIAQNVAGERLQVESLLPFGADPHAYQPTPSDVTRIAESTVLVMNGLDYEHFIEPMLENAGGERLVIEATAGLTPREMEADDHQDEDHTAGDPHMWLDPVLVITYVENIRDGLIEADPGGADVYTANAAAYISELQALDAWIAAQVENIPLERRLLVTNHESMGYFAARYGFEIVDTILPSFSSEAGVSAQSMAAAVESIRAAGAPAIFLGEVENDDFASQVATETGVKLVDSLYLETLTDGAPAPTYIEMMKHNVNTIVSALK